MTGGRTQDADGGAGASQRLDKWLWFARVIKTRTQAAALVTDGKVRLNRQRIEKPSQAVKPGDVVTVTVRGHIRVLKVLVPGSRRGPPTEAQQLFEDLSPPPPRKEDGPHLPSSAGGGSRAAGEGRPTKRDRRLIDRLQGGEE